MKSWLSKASSQVVSCPCTQDQESHVKSGLTYTVSQMAEAAARGRAISTANCALQPSQGVLNPDWEVPLDRQRGVDISDIYQAEQAARSKIRAFGLESRKRAKKNVE